MGRPGRVPPRRPRRRPLTPDATAVARRADASLVSADRRMDSKGASMSTAVLAPPSRHPARRRGSARPPCRRPLGLASLPQGVAPAVPDPRPHRRRRSRRRSSARPSRRTRRRRKNFGFGTAGDSATFTSLQRARGERDRAARAPLRARRGDRERDACRSRARSTPSSSAPRTRTGLSAVRCSRSSPGTTRREPTRWP